MRGERRRSPHSAEAVVEDGRTRRGPRPLALALGAGAVVIAGAVVVFVAGSGPDGETASAGGRTPTTTIERRDLVEVQTEDGTLGYADSRAVVNRMSGTVTWLPRAGSVVRTNGRLYAVDGKAVYLLDGSSPAYRDLAPGISGKDVRALERNLRALGKDPSGLMDVDGTWDGGTTAAVKRLQHSKGLAETGTIALGRVVFAPGDRRVSSLALKVGASAGSGSGGGGEGSNQPAAYDATDASAMRLVAYEATATTPTTTPAPTTTAPTTTTPQTTTTPKPSPKKPKAKTPAATKPTSPSGSGGGGGSGGGDGGGSGAGDGGGSGAGDGGGSGAGDGGGSGAGDGGGSGAGDGGGGGDSGGGDGGGSGAGHGGGGGDSRGGGGGASASAASARSGGAGGTGGGGGGSGGSESDSGSSAPSTNLMTTTSTHRIVTVALDTTKESVAVRGARVTVELPSGEAVHGRIARVGTTATSEQASDGSSSPPTIKLTIKLTERAKAIDQAPVTVRLERSRRRDVLAIPVTALMARSGGAFAVEVVEGGHRRVVPVTTGLFTSGYVEIDGAGLRPGMRVANAAV